MPRPAVPGQPGQDQTPGGIPTPTDGTRPGHDPSCTDPDHPEIACPTEARDITGDGIDGIITYWGTSSPTRGRRLHIIGDAALTSAGVTTLIAALQDAHKYLRR